MLRLLILAMIAILTAPAQALDEPILLELADDARDRSIPLLVRLPAAVADPAPVILVSHGLGGSRDSLTWAGSAWAEAGFVVIHLQHPGSDRSVWEGIPRAERRDALQAAASGRQALQRIGDVTAVLDALAAWRADSSHPWAASLDLEHIGMAGHSFGAQTTLAMMGRVFSRERSVNEPRLVAGLAFSPSPGHGVDPATAFGTMTRPLLLVTGTADEHPLKPDFDPADRQLVYANLPSGHAYQAVFHGATHGDFGNGRGLTSGRQDEIQRALVATSVDFWNAHLRDDQTAAERLRGAQTGFEPNDTWATK